MKNYFLFDEQNIDPGDTPDDEFKLIGACSFKAFLSFLKTAGKKQDIVNILPVILLAIDEGGGFSTAAKAYTGIIKRLTMSGKYVSFTEYILTEADEINNVPGTIAEITEMLTDNNVHVAAVDISNYLSGKLFDKYMSDFLRFIQKNRREAFYVLRCGRMDKDKLSEALDYISKFTDIKAIDFPSLTDEECVSYVKGIFDGMNVELSNAVISDFLTELSIARQDGAFYGFHTLKTMSETLHYNMLRKQVRVGGFTDDAAYEKHSPVLKKNIFTGEDELNELIGLSDVKRQIMEITRGTRYKREMGVKSTRSTLHMMFTGSPGTGKTSVARLLGKIFKENGILPTGNLIEVTRKDLVGEFIGQTALKTIDVCKMAMGGVLFIDEAYELAQDTENRRDFGPEAISTLIAEMENNRDRFVVIMAGYEKDMERLFSINAGLRDRFAYRLDFPNYTRNELSLIFLHLCGLKGYHLSPDCEAAVYDYFNKLPSRLLDERKFANARFVRNLSERSIAKAALRYHKQPEGVPLQQTDLDLITREDFVNASLDKDFIKLTDHKDNLKIGFGMTR